MSCLPAKGPRADQNNLSDMKMKMMLLVKKDKILAVCHMGLCVFVLLTSAKGGDNASVWKSTLALLKCMSTSEECFQHFY